jgi:sarcosine oxidase
VTAARRDFAVVGQGVIGLSTAVALARRGKSVIVLDALGSGHPLTSSTGASRSIRAAYAEPLYVRLALEALAAWRSLEVETGRSILHLTGQVDLAPAVMLDEIEAGMAAEGVASRRLDADGLADVFPELRLRPGEQALYHDSGGTVLAAEGMAALADVAADLGAELAAPEPVSRIELADDGVHLRSDARTVEAESVVVAAGPWSGELLSPLGIDLPLSPGVAQVTYVDVPHLVGRPGIADWAIEESGRGVYGHPVPGMGYKIAFDAAGVEPWSGTASEWPPDLAEQEQLLGWAADRFAGTAMPVIESQRHPWTMTPDTDFVIDADGRLVVACGCSGHAFKFGPALGKLVADIALGIDREERAMFSMRRPAMSLAAVDASTPIDR